MSMLFFIPLTVIALFESQIAHPRSRRIKLYFDGPEIDTDDDPKEEDPDCDGDDEGEISTVKFSELIKSFPKSVIRSVMEGRADI
jgi:hypothetical protein